jgi:hypothetical protein
LPEITGMAIRGCRLSSSRVVDVRSFVLILFLIWLMPVDARSAESVEGQIDFNRDVRPILSNNCFKCHGPDAAERKAGLRLDLPHEALKAAESGATPIVPGDTETSELVRRIFSEDASQRMPPADSNKRLTDVEKELLRRWINDGAA